MKGSFLLRIHYVKRGRLAFLSHKETVHAMERVVARAHLPYALTQGFSPHMRSSFGPALPVGCAGDDEILDVLLNSYISPDKALEQLQKAGIPDLMPTSCVYESTHTPSISADFPISDWQAEIAGTTYDVLQKALDNLLESGCIEIVKVKKTRRGQVEKVKRTEFEGRLLSAKIGRTPQRSSNTAGAQQAGCSSDIEGVQQAGCSSNIEGAQQAGCSSKLLDKASSKEALLVLWTSKDSGNGALRPDLFVNELIKDIPGAQVLSVKRLALRQELRKVENDLGELKSEKQALKEHKLEE